MAEQTIPEPANVRHLPIDPKRGIRVPWFVAWVDGAPEFRATDKLRDAIRFELCWVCGRRRGRYGTFCIGPMCGVNRTTAEPPCHRECAVWSARVCPFLTRPHARRRERNLPEGSTDAAGIAIKRNPGVALLWTTRDWKLFPAEDGVLFRIGDPTDVQWWAEGRAATRAEVDESIASGLPALREMAEEEGPEAVAELEGYVRRLEPLLPAAGGASDG